jgi:hypothetical protein
VHRKNHAKIVHRDEETVEDHAPTPSFHAVQLSLTSVPRVCVKDPVRALAAQQVQTLLEHDHAVVRTRAGRLTAKQLLQLRRGVSHPVDSDNNKHPVKTRQE